MFGVPRKPATAVIACGTAIALLTGAAATPEQTATTPATPTTPAKPVNAPTGVPAPPEVGASGWLLADTNSGEILASRDPDGTYAPASTIKTLTAVSLLPHLNLTGIHTATFEEAAMEGSRVGIMEDSTYTNKDLLLALMLNSGNDAAQALANEVGGLDQAVEYMNATAQEIGATSTVAKNTSGLDAPGQVTTAHDLAVIGRAALNDPELANIMVTRQHDFPGKGNTFGDDRETFVIGNHNKLIRNYDGATGVKTGYTIASRHTYIGAAKRGNRHLVVGMLKSDTRPWKDAIKLFDWGFEVADQAEPIGTLAAGPVETADTANPAAPGGTTDNTTTGSSVPARNQLLIAAAVLILGLLTAAGIWRNRSVNARRAARSAVAQSARPVPPTRTQRPTPRRRQG